MGAYRIIQLGSNGLRIEDPPTYWVGAFFALVAFVFFLSFSGSMFARMMPSDRTVSFNGERETVRRLGQGRTMPVVTLVVFLVTGYLAWAFLQPSSLVLNRSAGTYTVDTGRAFFVKQSASGQIADIAYATTETDSAAYRFVLVFQDGQRVGLGAYSDKGNQSEAAVAVNRFLHRQAPGETGGE